MNIFSVIKKYNFEIIAILLCFLFGIAGILVSLHRFWQYDSSFIDFGVYDQAIWKISRFQEPIVYHFIHGRINILGDHFTPSVYILSPLYWFTDKSEVVLIAQAVAVATSGIFLFDIGKVVLKNKLLAISILISYFLFVGLQNAVITEFHELTLMTLFLMITFWALVKKRILLFFIFLIFTLGFKEVTFSLGIGLGIALVLLKKEWRKIGLVTIILSAIWGILSLKVFMPYLSSGDYLYVSSLPGGFFDKAYSLVDEPLKRRTLFYSFFSFSFLPILSLEFWLLMLQDYATRFMPTGFITRWDLGLHYNAQSAVILSIASIYGLKRFLKVKIAEKYKLFISVIIILNSIFLFKFVLNGPFLLAINPAFYSHTKDFKFLDDMVSKVPKGASVMTQNNLAIRFTHQDIRLITTEYASSMPDYILLDLRPGQNPNSYFGSGDLNLIFGQLKTDKRYELFVKTGNQYLFKRSSL